MAEKKKAAKKPATKKAMPTAKKRPVGRPSGYREEFADKARKLCLLGATDRELADFFEVAESTLNLWKLEHADFSESIKEGKQEADAKVAESLYKRATGYVGQKVVTANVQGVISDVKVVDDYVGPETAAAIFWLKNRQKDKWRDKQDHEHSGPNGGPQQHEHKVTVSPEDAYKRMLDGTV